MTCYHGQIICLIFAERKNHKNEHTPQSQICGVNYFNARMVYRLRFRYILQLKFAKICQNFRTHLKTPTSDEAGAL